MRANEMSAESNPFLSKRRLGWAGLVAFLGCAACCALPLLVALGIGGGAVAALASLMRPGAELVVGAVLAMAALGVMALRARSKQRGCGTACRLDGRCCDARTARQGSV